MKLARIEIDKILNSLAETPRRLASMTQEIENSQLHSRSEAEPWSVNDILAHLRACADVWSKSIMAMISQDHPTLRYVSPRTWIRKTDYPAQEFRSSLNAFTKKREDFLKALQALEIKDWSRGATFTGTTKGQEQTVLSYAERISQHEDEHCSQIETSWANCKSRLPNSRSPLFTHERDRNMKRLSLLTLIFAVLSLAFPLLLMFMRMVISALSAGELPGCLRHFDASDIHPALLGNVQAFCQHQNQPGPGNSLHIFGGHLDSRPGYPSCGQFH